MEEKNILHTIFRTVCGKKYILMATDTAQIMSRQEQLEKSPQYGQTYKKISESIRNHIISGGALGFALSLSLQRYFPGSFASFGFNKVIVDLALITLCLFVSSNMATKANLNELGKIKKELMLNYDKQFLNHMAEIQIKFSIDQEDQIRGILTQEQYKQWVQKRHQHIF